MVYLTDTEILEFFAAKRSNTTVNTALKLADALVGLGITRRRVEIFQRVLEELAGAAYPIIGLTHDQAAMMMPVERVEHWEHSVRIYGLVGSWAGRQYWWKENKSATTRRRTF